MRSCEGALKLRRPGYRLFFKLLTKFAEGLAGNIRVGPIMPIIAAKLALPSIIGAATALKPIILGTISRRQRHAA
jgi:hypothetical protein